MTTWGDLLAEIRADLQDTGATARWSDSTLYLYTKDGIRDYSTWFPKRLDRVELSRSGETYPLPVDFIEDIHVECPANTYLEKRLERPGVKYRASATPLHYYTQGGSLYLPGAGAPPSGVLLTYFSTHPVPASERDSAFLLSIPDADIELIRLFVKAKVFGQMRGRQAALDRFKTGSGKRDDNPLEPEVVDLMDDYLRAVASRVRGGVISLYRLGRMR